MQHSNSVKTEIENIEQHRCQSAVDGDLASLADILDDDLVFVHSAGYSHNKQEYLSFLAEKMKILEISRPLPLTYLFLPDTVLVSGPLDQVLERRADGSIVEIHAIVSQAWSRRDGNWKLVHFHSTRRKE